MVFYITKMFQSTFDKWDAKREDKKWVKFSWMEPPSSVSWTPENPAKIDHTLQVQLYKKNHGETETFITFNNVTQVDFVKLEHGEYAMDLYDSTKQKITHNYLNTQPNANRAELKYTISKNTLIADDWHWANYLHWDFKALKDGSFRASMQFLPHAKFNTVRAPTHVSESEDDPSHTYTPGNPYLTK